MPTSFMRSANSPSKLSTFHRLPVLADTSRGCNLAKNGAVMNDRPWGDSPADSGAASSDNPKNNLSTAVGECQVFSLEQAEFTL
jgi:hypothetical protein